MMTNIDKILDVAFNAYNQGSMDRAEDLTREVLTAVPNQGDALYLLALIAYQKKALDSAIDILFQTVKLYPDVENYTLLLASILHEQGKDSESLKYYQKCPNHPQGITQQGFIYLHQKKEKKAQALFQKALSLSSQLPEALLGVAICQNDIDSIKQIAKKTNIPDAWFYLSRFYQKNYNDKEALEAINKTGLQTVAYLIEKGVILEKLNQPQKALEAYRLAAKTDPYRADVWTNQANIFRKNNELNAAEDYYKRALAQDANDMITRHNLASLLYQMNRIPESLEQYRFILSHQNDDKIALYNLAVILEKTGEWAEALGLYFKLLIDKVKFQDLDWRIADSIAALAEQGKESLKLATDFAKGWIKVQPNNPVAQHTFAALNQTKEKNILPYIKRLYDSFAETYQDKMNELNATAISEMIPILPQKKYKKGLDLGCGTGLFGKSFHGKIDSLVGVDISENMIKKAKETKCYTRLLNIDIMSFLSQNKSKFDLITAIEVLEYFPDLDELFFKIKSSLSMSGIFAFSIETTEKEPYLATNGRYLYPCEYIIEKIDKYGLKAVQNKEIKLRKEKHGFAMGRIFICQPK